MFAEGRRCPGDSVGALHGEFCGEPCSPQYPFLRPRGWSEVVLVCQMLSRRGEQHIPPVVADTLGFGLEEGRLSLRFLPAVFL